MPNKKDWKNKWAQIVAKAWMDEKFKHRLINQPRQVLKEQGIDLPSHLNIKIVEDTKETIYLHIPIKPEGTLSETELKNIAAAAPQATCL